MRYRIEDTIVDTDKASACFSIPARKTGYGEDRGDLYRSKKGRWYLVHDFSWCVDTGLIDYAEWLSPQEAARLIVLHGGDLAEWPELKKVESDVLE